MYSERYSLRGRQAHGRRRARRRASAREALVPSDRTRGEREKKAPPERRHLTHIQTHINHHRVNPFPFRVTFKVTRAFRADARLRARRRP